MKKFRSLPSELRALAFALQQNPKMGIPIGREVYKIRLSVRSKGKGKSGGMRVISYVEFTDAQDTVVADVYLLAIYDKSAFENIPDSVLRKLVADIQEEMQSEGDAGETE
ncbi:MAG: hypothetical protein RMJ33_09815 [Saprospiraceae bacterium]|nr:hypothetical protein [Saprospiraceae bacterium]MDW8230121.1 hypothetical protein [Saprospiraceae bacterium]